MFSMMLFTHAVSAQVENWTSLGGHWLSYSETTGSGTDVVETSFSTLGVSFSGFSFWNQGRLGLGATTTIFRPRTLSQSSGGQSVSVSTDVYDFLLGLDVFLVPRIEHRSLSHRGSCSVADSRFTSSVETSVTST